MADFNGDGNPDLVDGRPATVSCLGNGDGTFAGRPETTPTQCAGVAGDFNGDGSLDR